MKIRVGLFLYSVLFLAGQASGGSIVIPAWAFDRGNVVIDANPAGYADAGPVVVSGPKARVTHQQSVVVLASADCCPVLPRRASFS